MEFGQKKITIIGGAVVDIVAGPVDEGIFTRNSTPVSFSKVLFGGDALNESVVLGKMGAEVELISKVGDDDAGKQILRYLQENGVDSSAITVCSGLETGVNVVLVDENGERRFLTNPKSNLRNLGEADILPYLESAGDLACLASIFVSPLLTIPAMVRVAKEYKREKDRILLADMTMAKQGERASDLAELLPFIDYLIPNEAEAELLTGETSPEACAKAFLQYGANCVLIKCGKDGVLLMDCERSVRIPSYPHSKLMDTTGAGDSFAAGFMKGLLDGLCPEEAAAFGCAVASFTVESIGATTSRYELTAIAERFEMIKGNISYI